MPVKFEDVSFAFDFVGSEDIGIHCAWLNRETGETHLRSEMSDDYEELPDDIEDEKYIAIPHKKELDLGKPLVLRFVREHLPDDLDEAYDMFSRKGGYARFRRLLARRRAVDRWYDFSAKAEQKALREWCAENAIDLVD
jgi:hypothetical protein